MFSVFEGSAPNEIHLSKLALWLTSEKGAESSVRCPSEDIRHQVEELLVSATQSLAISLPTEEAIILEKRTFKAKSLCTYYDYLSCLERISHISGPRGEKNMFGAYTEPCLVDVATSLTKWEEGNLHLVSTSEALAKLVLLTHPSAKNAADKLNSRSDELSRVIREHERLATGYMKDVNELCDKWGVGLDASKSNENDVVASSSLDDIKTQGKLVADSVAHQLDTLVSNTHQKYLLDELILTPMNTPEFLDCYLHYHSYLRFLEAKQCADVPETATPTPCLNTLPLLQLVLRLGSIWTDAHAEQLYQPPVIISHRKSSLDSSGSGSGDEWTHVSATEVSDSASEQEKDMSAEEFQQLMETSSGRDMLLQEVVLLRSFFLSQTKMQDEKEKSKLSVDFTMASVVFCGQSLEVLQSILDAFSSNEFLNILALENNPTYRKRIIEGIALKYEKYLLFSSMTRREAAEKDAIVTELAAARSGLTALHANIIFLKSALEGSLEAKYGHSINIVGDELAAFV